jgi:acyl-coenzyme A thioesterase PaaI-like protein
MTTKAIQDYYRDAESHCYGCGSLNQDGLQLKSYWDGEASTATFSPKPYHTAIKGIVYGGLIASIVDCHGTGTAAAAATSAAGLELGKDNPLRFVTASLQVDYMRPTPMGVPLELRGTVDELKERKVTVAISVTAQGELVAKGTVIAVQVPENWAPGG